MMDAATQIPSWIKTYKTRKNRSQAYIVDMSLIEHVEANASSDQVGLLNRNNEADLH